MDDNAKNASSYHLDQEILDARGINMTVEEVAGLPTGKYSERVHALKLPEQDLAFLKGLRRRIKNRLASQNSRRRSMEHLRRLTRELRVVRACRNDALAERKVLLMQRDEMREKCHKLRHHVAETLRDRLDATEVPNMDVTITESHADLPKDTIKDNASVDHDQTIDKNVFECRIDKLVQKSVNHMFNNNISKRKIFAKTIFIGDEKKSSFFDSPEFFRGRTSLFAKTDVDKTVEDVGSLKTLGDNRVLNLSVKNEGRRSHGRKQSAPRRIAYVDYDVSDCVLDLKIKKEPQ
ncbi:unnamed protein product [Chilo suppressalis]|uniref:BZIP domain-containing protein n=1 Tax=Chilo suppressalis TaxID=168631 RepID=A0ABN8B9Z0_CHISP|nr:unnamed protein product [Chilo suppressalis]